MSDQNKSNFQAFGAGLLGFVAVMAVGGGAMMFQSSRRSQAAVKPAAAPIDIGAPVARPVSPANIVHSENRAQSPAPLIGEDGAEGADEQASSSGVAAESASAASENETASRLKVTRHLDVQGNGSTAKAVVKNTLSPEEAPKAAAKPARLAAPKLDAEAGGAEAVASSVHYGVTSRSELMGRAAGPVYNFKGAGGKKGGAAMGEMAADVNAKIAEIKRQLEDSNLSPEEREKLLKQLSDADPTIAK